MRMIRSGRCLAIAAIGAGCSGGATAPDNSCKTNCNPPPAETVSVSVALAVGTGVAQLTATAVSSTAGPITQGDKYTWVIGGQSQTGPTVSLATPGSVSYCVTVAGASTTGVTCATAQVPGFRGKLLAVDLSTTEAAPNGVFARFSKGTSSLVVNPGSDGSFSLISPLADNDSVSFVVDALDTSNRIYHPMMGVVTRADMVKDITFIMSPLSVLIPQGCAMYGGTRVPYDINKAYIAGTDNRSFYRRDLVNGVWNYRIASHKTLPQPIAIRNDLGDTPISASDSALAMNYAMVLNQYLCGNFVRAGNRNDVTQTDGINAYVLSTNADYGSGDVNYLGNGEYGNGMVYFQTVAGMTTASNGGALRHELLHAFGFVHGCGWASMMNQSCGSYVIDNTGFVPGVPSATDVTYILMLYKTRDLERKYNSQFSIMESHQGERVLMLGFAPEKVVREK